MGDPPSETLWNVSGIPPSPQPHNFISRRMNTDGWGADGVCSVCSTQLQLCEECTHLADQILDDLESEGSEEEMETEEMETEEMEPEKVKRKVIDLTIEEEKERVIIDLTMKE